MIYAQSAAEEETKLDDGGQGMYSDVLWEMGIMILVFGGFWWVGTPGGPYRWRFKIVGSQRKLLLFIKGGMDWGGLLSLLALLAYVLYDGSRIVIVYINTLSYRPSIFVISNLVLEVSALR